MGTFCFCPMTWPLKRAFGFTSHLQKAVRNMAQPHPGCFSGLGSCLKSAPQESVKDYVRTTFPSSCMEREVAQTAKVPPLNLTYIDGTCAPGISECFSAVHAYICPMRSLAERPLRCFTAHWQIKPCKKQGTRERWPHSDAYAML